MDPVHAAVKDSGVNFQYLAFGLDADVALKLNIISTKVSSFHY